MNFHQKSSFLKETFASEFKLEFNYWRKYELMTDQAWRTSLIVIQLLMVALSVVVFLKFINMPNEICNVGINFERYERVFKLLNDTIDLSITLATGVLSLGAALLIGLNVSVKLEKLHVVAIFISLIFLAQSIAYGLYWKFSLANLWYNECYNLIGSRRIQYFYESHLACLAIGLAFVAILVAMKAWSRVRTGGVR